MGFNAFVDANQVIVEILYGLRCEYIQKLFDPKLILVQHIIKGQGNNYLGYPRPDVSNMMPIVEETLEERRKEVENLCLQIVFPLHMPLELEYAFLDGIQDVLDNDFIVCGVAREMKVLCQDSEEDQNGFLRFVVLCLSGLVVILPIDHQKVQFLSDFEAVGVLETVEEFYCNGLCEDNDCSVYVHRGLVITIPRGDILTR